MINAKIILTNILYKKNKYEFQQFRYCVTTKIYYYYIDDWCR